MTGRFRKYTYPMPPSIYCGVQDTTNDGGATWINPIYYNYNTSGNYSEAGFCSDALHPGPPYRTGGLLGIFRYSNDRSCRGGGEYITMISPTSGYRYRGGFVQSYGMGFSNPSISVSSAELYASTGTGTLASIGDVSSYGATGWKKFRPGNPVADLGVFLGEAKDVPRMLFGTATYFRNLWRSMGGDASAFKPKAVADQWLNTQFGWLPFVSDLRKFYKTYVTLDERIARIKRYNGRWQKRGGAVLTVDTDSIVTQAVGNIHWPALPTYMYRKVNGSRGNYTITDIYKRKVWFEGSFRYWIPNIESPIWRKRAIVELFGAKPNPSLLWELTPWSWLIDWFSNVGDVIANFDNGWADNLAARYAYVMGTTQCTRVIDSTSYMADGTNIHITSTYPLVWKSRVGASPFGFGLTSEDLSARQWSILAALGISKLRSSW